MSEMASDILLSEILNLLADRIAARIRPEDSTSQTPQRLLNINQAATYLNRSASSVRHLVSTGKLQSVRLDGRVFLDIRDLDQAIERAKS